MEENNNHNEPVVLGTLRKEKSSKPVFVFIVFTIILGVCFGLPYLEDYFGNPNSFLGSIFNPSSEEKVEQNPVTEDTLLSLNENTTLSFRGIAVSNTILKDNKITYDIKSYTNNSINLDEKNYYLEIYNATNKLLKQIKLTGNIGSTAKTVEHNFTDLKFNSSNVYYGKIQELKEEDYSEITLSSDESGLASITCTQDGNTYKYIFANKQLKNLNHTLTYTNTENIELYLEKFNQSNEKSKKINEIIPLGSDTEETDTGFIFTVNLDLEKIKLEEIRNYIDYNYYSLNTSAKKVNFEMKAKGFDCQ